MTLKRVLVLTMLLGYSVPLSAELSLRILHTNDIHSRFLPCDSLGGKCLANCYGGILRRSHIIKSIREKDGNTILFDAGDQLTGTLWYNVFKGNASAYFINDLRYDAVTLGNHEFDLGVDHIVEYLKQLQVPVVVSNLHTDQEKRWIQNPPLYNRSFVIKREHTSIGLCGYTLKSTPRYSNPGPNVIFGDEIEAVKLCSKEHKRNGIKIIMAIGHSGFDLDLEVAKLVEDVDIVIGGHTNTFLYNGKPPTSNIPKGPYPVVVKSEKHIALVVQSYGFGIYLGNLNVTFDDNGTLIRWSGEPILLDEKVPDDLSLKDKVEELTKKVDNVAKRKIGRSNVYLEGRFTICGQNECNLGNLMADAMISSYAKLSENNQNREWAPASVALWSAGSIMASISVSRNSSIDYDDVYNAFPYQNTIDCVSLYGQDLRQMIEFSLADLTTTKSSNRFMQVSGLKLVIDINRKPMNRIVDINIRCLNCSIPEYKMLDNKMIYKVLLPSYIARGGAGYFPYIASFLTVSQGEQKDVDVIANYIERMSPITIGIEGRIQHYKDGDYPCFSSADARGSLTLVYLLLSIVGLYYVHI